MDLLKPSPANSSPLTPLGFLERAATVYGDCTSIIYNKTTYTWKQTNRRCLQLASSLKSMGIQRGDVISVLSPNLPAMYELHFAVPMSGAILNTINTRLDAHALSVILRHNESKLVFVDFLSRSLILEAFSLLPSENKSPSLIFIMDDEVNSTLTADCIDLDFTYEGLINKGDPDFKWVRPNRELDPMVLNYTSGTTSSPKGVVHSHRGLFITTLDSLMDWCVPKQPVFLWTLAMFHSNGWSFPWGMAAVGGTNICLRKFDAASVYGLICQHSVTHMCGAPVVLNMLANNPSKEPLSDQVQILTAGAPPPATVLFRIESLGFIVSHGYGLTETAGCVVSCAWKHEWDKFPATERARLKARQGVRTIGMTEIDVLDPDSGLSVKRDGSSTGEIVLRGDVGVMHPDGYIEIKDRSKDVIISGGENISSVEVESVLYSHPAINEAAVVARPDKFWGETPCAFVSLKSKFNSLSENDIIEFCREKLPHYMVPKTVIFEEFLPKTTTGKIQKFKLKSKAKNLGLSRVESRL
ncbi:probable acyl-activating enzyme 6 [Papaver somniferum]|uniref:probable acyl-activating enzyme 6 n=1 Tax=Papaver somniferum TaxID=3469 RepID=UPI000E6FFEFA|nr:probable acyl-activating enzyme 6 [Papaver somniferum]